MKTSKITGKNRLNNRKPGFGTSARILLAIVIFGGLIGAAANLEALLDFGLFVSGGNANGARDLCQTQAQTYAFKSATQAAREQCSAKSEGRKLRFYYTLVSSTERKVSHWLQILRAQLEPDEDKGEMPSNTLTEIPQQILRFLRKG